MNYNCTISSIDDLHYCLGRMASTKPSMQRPFVTVSYAQSIDGSIATKDRHPVRISGHASMVLTHQLRSISDSILVGINTVLSDNPNLTVRLVEGVNPQPVVLDTHLRTPIDSRLIKRTDCRSWLASANDTSKDHVDALTRAGAEILPCRKNDQNKIDLDELMRLLYAKGIRSLMVEGGAQVISSFILAELVDLFIITISPMFLGGLQAIDIGERSAFSNLTLTDTHYQYLDNDMILWAKPIWSADATQ